MAIVSYVDNNSLLGQCYVEHAYYKLRTRVLEEINSLTYYLEEEGNIYGYVISTNVSLSSIYQFPCYVVKFVFSAIDTFHRESQEQLLGRLCLHLYSFMQTHRGYYNLRIPTHIVDLLKAVNHHLEHLIFCGGTVDEIYIGGFDVPPLREGIEVFFADFAFAMENRNSMIQLAYDSFKKYQGQYHISPVTEERAGEIYSRWIQGSFDNFRADSILVGQYHGKIVGFGLIEENNIAVDLVLGCVSDRVRGLGVYKAIGSSLVRYAASRNKLFVSSTQLDNFISQGIWASLGMRPFCSIYNFHYDNR